jgi:hypothetical protein
MKEIKDFPGYFITEDGRVFSARKKRKGTKSRDGFVSYLDYKNLNELKTQINSRGYCFVGLNKLTNNKIKQYNRTIHRLIAEHFIPNPGNLPQVNHIDENKLNNNISNLEWCTAQYNMEYSKCYYKWTIENIITKQIHEVINLNQFCKNNNLHFSGLYQTYTKRISRHKNYRIIKREQFKYKE